ncbi:hypothetical protein SERLA73DRAFT_110123 [Serpula lacrymans var. lacrymans S7.3]|uniref:Uncharacterized protein n=2 Tax=Serpula lacrymans var. lacrymans TaxID=341189 RepID=F8Q0B5_SERL3|nr:uncharacterized protein SERLADRAFT_362183 [Serpula lacrymans var. lacrymans S7.9]EGN98565.1 hypothetical protein SERLA73DRAFT_110123 [Serpula lacrymans var. lacrymans S7.3]EGO24131.1 hypothetical protein SERLADRAFT_362183 [Serpula lacrymans var. lacrymans S7.9]
MTHTELWLTYHQISRCDKPATAQLIELEFQNQKLCDLEDIMEHLFRQGFVEAKHRSLSWWEKCDGQKVKGSFDIEELLKQGVGKCPDTALRLIIADAPPAVWFSYVYLRNTTGAVVTQRVKLDTPETKFEIMAHLTNHIFKHGFLPANVRSLVYWQTSCGRRIEEHFRLEELLTIGDGLAEEAPLRLVIDHAPCHPHHPICHH